MERSLASAASSVHLVGVSAILGCFLSYIHLSGGYCQYKGVSWNGADRSFTARFRLTVCTGLQQDSTGQHSSCTLQKTRLRKNSLLMHL